MKMADPGIYLINSTGETVALATESGAGDRELLHETLDEMDIDHPRGWQDVVVATFTTNMVGTEEANSPGADVFRTIEIEERPGSMHDTIRPRLEDRYGTVEDLRCHPTHIREIGEGDEDA